VEAELCQAIGRTDMAKLILVISNSANVP
jgi:hypothetical protein